MISVKLYYELNWNMMFHHNFSLTEIENMMPWEREIYIGFDYELPQRRKRTNGTRREEITGLMKLRKTLNSCCRTTKTSETQRKS